MLFCACTCHHFATYCCVHFKPSKNVSEILYFFRLFEAVFKKFPDMFYLGKHRDILFHFSSIAEGANSEKGLNILHCDICNTWTHLDSQDLELDEEKIPWSGNLLGISFKQWKVFLKDSWGVFAQHSRCTDLQSFKILFPFVTKFM